MAEIKHALIWSFSRSIIIWKWWKESTLRWTEPTWTIFILTVSWRRPLSYRNQSIDLRCNKSMDWFLYDNGLYHERVKLSPSIKLIRNNTHLPFINLITDEKVNSDIFWINRIENIKNKQEKIIYIENSVLK